MYVFARYVWPRDLLASAYSPLLQRRQFCTRNLLLTRRLYRAAGIVTFRLTLHVCGVDRETAWTVLNLSHAAFSFYYVHWLKGMPMFRCATAHDTDPSSGKKALLPRYACTHAYSFQRSLLYRTHWVTHGAAYCGLRCRGTPDYDEKYDRLTFWEQLDGGTQYTLNKKFLTIIPIVLFLFTISNCAQYSVLCCLAFGL